MFGSVLLSVVCVIPLCPSADPQSPPTVAEVRRALAAIEFGEQYKRLVEYGERAFAVYETILDDPKVGGVEVARIFAVLSEVKGDRSRFLDRAVTQLANKLGSARMEAVTLIGHIGSSREAAPVAVLLSDEFGPAAHEAATALAAIGGPREVIAFEAWLQATGKENPGRRKHVEKCRDALKQRLEKQKKARS